MKKYIIISITLLIATAGYGQSYGDFMRQLIERSPQLRSLEAQRTADSLGARRGLNPLDPEVDLEYTFGREQAFELVVAQQFDFPTVYHQRNKIAAHTIERGDVEFMASRRALLLEASELYNTVVYLHRLRNVYTDRLTNYARLDSLSQIALSRGGITAVEQSKLAILRNSAQAEKINIDARYSATEARLHQLGSLLDASTMEFADFRFSGSREQFIQAATEGDWALQAARIDSLIASRSLKLARSEWAPGLKVGYKISSPVSQPMTPQHSLVAGITIPLWQNRNNIKHSKAQITASSATLRSTESQLLVNLANLFDSYTAATTAQQRWQQINMGNYRDMLRKSLDSGAITLMDYLLEITQSQDTETQMIDAQYQKALIGGQMALYLY